MSSNAELLKKLKGRKLKLPGARKGPLWDGPAIGGITQGLIARWLSCKERFRLLVIEGVKTADAFDSRTEFGNMWHVCEQALAGEGQWEPALRSYVNQVLVHRYPMQREQIGDWFAKCAALFPVYVRHWQGLPDNAARTPLLQEQVFEVRHELPSGRWVWLRGKWDSVDVISKGPNRGVWLQENKTKSAIDRKKIELQLGFDLQTMLYLVALEAPDGLATYVTNGRHSLAGVRYNVARRPAHKSVDSMLKKVDDDRKARRIGEWFDRWNVKVSQADIQRFRFRCLDPILENIFDDYEWWSYCKMKGYNPFDSQERQVLAQAEGASHYPRHFQMPYGIYNPLAEGGYGEIDQYMLTGAIAGIKVLKDSSELFPELGGMDARTQQTSG
jgi:hypothetical protein